MVLYRGDRLLITWEGWKWMLWSLYSARLGAKAILILGFQIAWRDLGIREKNRNGNMDMSNTENERADAMNRGLNKEAFRLAWHAFQNTPIDMAADSDDETCKCLSNAIRVFVRSVAEEAVRK